MPEKDANENARKLERMHVITYVGVRDDRGDELIGHLVDITAKGLRIHGCKPLKPHSRLGMRLILPGVSDPDGLPITTDTVWCGNAQGTWEYDAGFKIVDVSEESLGLIRQFMERHSYGDRWLAAGFIDSGSEH